MKEQIKNYLGILGLLLMSALLVLVVIEIKNRGTSVDYGKTIQMSGEGKVTARPDTANLSFAVVTQGADSAKVQADNDTKMKKVIEYLKQNGVKEEDIKTSGYNLYPQYDYKPDGSSSITGYNLNQNVDAKLRDLGKVPSIMGGLTGQGVNQINGVNYFIDDPDALRTQARDEAIAKAKEKAQNLASTLGIKLGKVINFSEGESYIPYPMPYYAERGIGAGGGGTSPTEPGSQDVTMTVTLTFELK